MRRLRTALPIVLSCLTLACDGGGTAAPPDATPAEVTPDEAPVAEAQEPTPEEKAEADRQAREERIAKAIEDLEDDYAARSDRWTDELDASIKALIDKKYKRTDKALTAILASKHRLDENVARDPYRHPKETLMFFGIKPTHTVVEVGPGGGWYTEILAPLVAKQGKLRVPTFDTKGPKDQFTVFLGRRVQLMLAQSKELFGAVEPVMQQNPPDTLTFGPEASADMVIATREMHNWHRGGTWDRWMAATTEVLKPGGTFAVVQHRAPEGADPDESANNGRLPEEWVIERVEEAGYELLGKSEINANPKDTGDFRVWNLPPASAVEDEDERAKYDAIGESDRMTLKFKKK